MSKLSEIELLRAEIEKLKADKTELSAKVWILERDVSILGPENVKLSNAYNAALAEIARLKTPKGKGKRGRPPKDTAGSYETYLFRETQEVVNEHMRDGKKITERDAAIIADEKIRKTAGALQKAGLPGAFAGISPNYSSNGDVIYNAFRRAKRAAGFSRKSQTKK